MKKVISYDDLSCLVELARLYLSSRNNPKFFAEEQKVVDDMKTYLALSAGLEFTIEPNKTL